MPFKRESGDRVHLPDCKLADASVRLAKAYEVLRRCWDCTQDWRQPTQLRALGTMLGFGSIRSTVRKEAAMIGSKRSLSAAVLLTLFISSSNLVMSQSSPNDQIKLMS